MRFLADMGVSTKVVDWLRAQGHDAVHLQEQGLHRSKDPAVLAKAIAESRVQLAFDLDFGEIIALSHGKAAAVILFRLRNARADNVIVRLREVLHTSADVLGRGVVIVVEETRHRVRLLPIGRPE